MQSHRSHSDVATVPSPLFGWSLEDLEQMHQVAGLAVWSWRVGTQEFWWSRHLYRITGKDPELFHPTLDSTFRCIHPDDQEATLQRLWDAVADQQSYERGFRMLRDDGTVRHCWAKVHPICEEGHVTVVRGICLDVTDLRRAEDLAREYEANLHYATEHNPQLVWTADPDGNLLSVNSRWTEVTGLPVDAAFGHGWLDLIHPEDQDIGKALAASAQTPSPLDAKYRMRCADGSYRWIRTRGRPRIGATGEILRWYGVSEDIHDQQTAEEALRASEERYRLASRATRDLIFDLDLRSGQMTYGEVTEPVFGYLPEELGNDLQWWSDRIHPGDCIDFEAAIAGGQSHVDTQFRLRRADGTFAAVISRGSIVRDSSGVPVRLVGATQDVSESRTASEALARRERQLANIFGQALVGILQTEADGRIKIVNARYCEILGRSEAELKGCKTSAFTHPDDVGWNQRLIEEHLETREPFQVEKRYIRPDASTVWCRVNVSHVIGASGAVESAIVVAEDITQQRKTAENLKWASEHDPLTELPNRRAFQARLQKATNQALVSGGKVGLLLIDLDHFKHVNDTSGHTAGDRVLKVLASRLEECLREGDFVARLGGDEFAVILERRENDLNLVAAGKAILARLQQPVGLGYRTISTGASIGGAVFPKDSKNANELFENADIAVYALKDGGRGGTKMFEPQMRARAEIRSTQLHLARTAIRKDTVEPHYQQKVDLGSGRIAGFEALLRWRDPSGLIRAPESIAEAFRHFELAAKIGELMQRRAFRDAREWLDQELPLGRITINAAPVEFLRDDFAEKLIASMDEHGLPASSVEIEVTEHVFLEPGSDYVSRALKLLKQAGARIALDDFGTGYSSLSHLRDFPVDVIKIDRSFIAQLTSNPEIEAIVSAVIDLAGKLKVEVVAEGVETEEQRLALIERGCPFAQGYLFGRAVAAEQVPRLLRDSAT